jgi:hypothetical protein
MGQLLVPEYCRVVLSNSTLIEELRNENFNLAIVDLVYNECSLVRFLKGKLKIRGGDISPTK